MRLWTFQSQQSITELTDSGILRARWSRNSYRGIWKIAYEWMRDEMEAKRIPCREHAPIWAWHSCGQYGRGPTLGDASNLLSQNELNEGISTIEFECPDELALLTRYGPWNDIIHLIIDEWEETGTARPPQIPSTIMDQLYDLRPESLEDYQSIQACLPFLKQDWVYDMRPLKLIPGQFDFDGHEPV